MRKLVEGQGMALEVSAEAKEFVAEQGYDAEYGARPMKRAIQRLVENPLSSALLRGQFVAGDTITVDLADGGLVFTK
jgi:ATP-dependent Clp protease ATP-binding subunit ClpA